MSFAHVNFRSEALGRDLGMNVLVPDRARPPWPVLYLLHGLSDDETKWQRMTALERHAAGRPFLIAMPDGGRGAYANHVGGGPRYFDYVVDDVIGVVERTFRVRTDRGGRCVQGLSMGGYGAVLLGLRRPELFASVVSHSGALLWGHIRARDYGGGLHDGEYDRVFGTDPAGGEHDLLALAERRADDDPKDLPAIRLDCGRGDFILDHTTAAHDALDAAGVKHEFELFDGGHDWAYWDARLPASLAFHARHLTPAPA